MSPRLRYAIAGVGGLALAVVLGLVIAAILRGVTAPADVPVAAPPTPSTTAAAPPPAPEPQQTVASRPEPGTNECVDALGDGEADLDSVRVSLDDGDLAVQFTLAAPLSDGELGLSVTADDGKSYLLGVEVRGGRVEKVSVQDFDRSRTEDVRRPTTAVDGTTVTVVFPEEAVKRIGDRWEWSAFASADGSERDSCPVTRFER